MAVPKVRVKADSVTKRASVSYLRVGHFASIARILVLTHDAGVL